MRKTKIHRFFVIFLINLSFLSLIFNVGCSSSNSTVVDDLTTKKNNEVIISGFDEHVFLVVNLSSVGLDSENSGLHLSNTMATTASFSVSDLSDSFIPDFVSINDGGGIKKNQFSQFLSGSNFSVAASVDDPVDENTPSFTITVRTLDDSLDDSYNIITENLVVEKKYGDAQSKCLIYVEQGYTGFSDWDDIGQEFDDKIYPVADQFIPDSISFNSDFLDIDGNDKIILIYYDVGVDQVGGMVIITDLLDEGSINAYNELNPSDAQPFIKKDVLYLNTALLSDFDKNYATIAHEFQHLVSNHLKIHQSDGGVFTQFDLWIEEGLAESAADIYCKEKDKANNFIRSKNLDVLHNSGDIANGEGFIYWNQKIENYALSYLFFQYLRIHSNLGLDFYRHIQQQEVRNYQVLENLFVDSGFLFEDLLLNFHIAMVVDSDDPNSVYGFGSEYDDFNFDVFPNVTQTESTVFPGGRLVWNLPNKEAVNSIQLNSSGDNIYYYFISGE